MNPAIRTIGAFLVCAAAAAAQELLNSSFDADAAGWSVLGEAPAGVTFDRSTDGGRKGSGALHIADDDESPKACRVWNAFIEKPPTGKGIRISAWIRGKGDVDIAAVALQSLIEGREGVSAYATTAAKSPLKGDFEWTQVSVEVVPDAGTRLQVMAYISGPGEAWFDDVVVSAVPLKKGFAAAAPGLFEIRGDFNLVTTSDKTATILVPLPLDYREQVPVAWSLETEPAEALTAARVKTDAIGNAWLEADLALTNADVAVHWTSLVLCAPRSFADLPKTAALPAKWPEEAAPWLKATRCVECDDKRMKEAARLESRDALVIVRETLEKARDIQAKQEGACEGLGALEALDHRGSCTSNANLVAAMLRANGVPARVLAGYPSWAGPLQTHYIVEANLGKYGWYPVESTMCKEPWPPFQQIEVAIVTPENEDLSGPRRFAVGGVPFRSLTECAGNDPDVFSRGTNPDAEGNDHACRAWWNYPENADWKPALAAARRAWQAWLKTGGGPDAKHRVGTKLTPESLEPSDLKGLEKAISEGK